MKTYLECVKQAASIRGLKGAIKQLYFKLPQELIETLKEAADMYATQSNSHKHSVSGKRPMLTEIQIVQAMAAVDEARQKLEALLAACASGAVDKTVSDGFWCVEHDRFGNNKCKRQCELCETERA